MPSAPEAVANKPKPFDGENVLTDTAVVVIGRNEGERLRRCLASLLKHPSVRLVYVDSGSTDNSVTLVAKLGVHVIELDPSTPFSMARARNTGFSYLLSSHPDLRFVQFVDGDCELEAGWLVQAQRFLSSEENAATVCGHLRERSPQTSIYNRLADMEWQGPVGEIAACGGIAMYRASAIESVNGFNENMIAGEESDLCARLRQAGGQIWRLDHPMAIHDSAMTRFSQWWTRTRRSGFARAYDLMASNNVTGKKSSLQLLGILLYGLLLPTVWIAVLVYSLPEKDLFPFYVTNALVLAVLLKPMLGAFKYKINHGNTFFEALLYAIFCTLGKIPESFGIIAFFLDFMLDRKTKIIEYKSPTS